MKKTTKKTKESEVKEDIQEVNEIEKVKQCDIYNQYKKDHIQYRIKMNNEIIFDSKNKMMKDYPVFSEKCFIVDGKKYIYNSIIIETY